MQFHDFDTDLVRHVKNGFSKMEDKLEADYKASLKQKSIMSYFKKWSGDCIECCVFGLGDFAIGIASGSHTAIDWLTVL